MAAGDPTTGHGITVDFESGIIAKVTNLEHTITRESVDVTNADTVEGMEKIPQEFYDAGQVSGSAIFDDTTDFLTAMKNDKSSCKITYPTKGVTGQDRTADGFLTSWGTPAPYDDKITVDFEIELTGTLTVTAAADT